MEGKSLFNMVARALQFLWALLVMSLSGNMIAESWNGSRSSPNIVGYAMFCAAFAMLSLIFLIPASLKESFAFHPVAPFAVDVLNNIFWFCGAIAFAAELTATNCNNYGFLVSNKVTNAGPNMSKQCHEGQAVTAFLWFGWAAFMASTVISGVGLGGSGGLRRGGLSRGPQMSKV